MTDFGRDVLCLDSLLTGRYATGLRVLGQRCYHRLITPRGMLRGGADEGNFGLDLASKCGAASSASLRAALPSQIENELRKDPQVLSATAAIVWTEPNPGQVEAEITVTVESAEGPFDLVLAVSSVSARLLKLVT